MARNKGGFGPGAKAMGGAGLKPSMPKTPSAGKPPMGAPAGMPPPMPGGSGRGAPAPPPGAGGGGGMGGTAGFKKGGGVKKK